MAISGVGGPNQPENTKLQGSLRRTEVSQDQWNIFDKADANKDGVLDTKEKKNFLSMLANAFGVGKTNKSEQAKPTGKPEDVNGATNQPQVQNTTTNEFSADGSYKQEVTDLGGGNKTIKTGGEELNVTPDSVNVTGKDGKPVGSVKQLPNGMQVLSQPDGKQGVYDPSKGQFLPDNEAQKILAQMG